MNSKPKSKSRTVQRKDHYLCWNCHHADDHIPSTPDSLVLPRTYRECKICGCRDPRFSLTESEEVSMLHNLRTSARPAPTSSQRGGNHTRNRNHTRNHLGRPVGTRLALSTRLRSLIARGQKNGGKGKITITYEDASELARAGVIGKLPQAGEVGMRRAMQTVRELMEQALRVMKEQQDRKGREKD